MNESPQRNSGLGRFAQSFEPYYDGNRGPVMQWVDRHGRQDLFTRYSLTFERLGDLKGKRGLDIGCGSGLYVAEAIRRGAAHVVAIDPAPGMLELTRTRVARLAAPETVTLVEGFFPEKLPRGPFDFVIIMGVLDYVVDPLSFFKGLRPMVTGKVAVSFPSNHWLRAPLRKLRYRLRNCPVYFYTQRQIHSLGRQAGFGAVDVIEVDGAGSDYHVCLAP